MKLFNIIQSFEHIEDFMQEIDSKNNKFIESPINRITLLLNNKKDVEGKTNQLIKVIANGNHINNFVTENFLYVPRQFNTAIQKDIEKIKKESLNRLIKSQDYSHKKIEERVLKMLKEKGELALYGATKSKGFDKENSIRLLLQHLHADEKDAIAFGDGVVDIPIFKACGHSVAMGNSNDEVKQSATYVTDDVNNDDLYKTFEYLGLI